VDTRYAELTGQAVALVESILINGLDRINRELATEFLAKERAMHEDPEHLPIEPTDSASHYNRQPCGCPIDSGCTGWHSDS